MADHSQNLSAGQDEQNPADDRPAKPQRQRDETPALKHSEDNIEDNIEDDAELSAAMQVPLAAGGEIAATEADDDLPGSPPDMFLTLAAGDTADPTRVGPAAHMLTAAPQPALPGSNTAGMSDLQTTAPEIVGGAAAPDVAEADVTEADMPAATTVPPEASSRDQGASNGSHGVVVDDDDDDGSTTACTVDKPSRLPEEDPEETQPFIGAEFTSAAEDVRAIEAKPPPDNATVVALTNNEAEVGDDGNDGDETGVAAAATTTTVSSDAQPSKVDDASSSHAAYDADTAEHIDAAERSEPTGVGEQAPEQELNLSMNVDNLYLTQNSPAAESQDNESQAEQDPTSAPASKPAAITEVDEAAVSDKSESPHKVGCQGLQRLVIAAAVAHLSSFLCLAPCCMATSFKFGIWLADPADDHNGVSCRKLNAIQVSSHRRSALNCPSPSRNAGNRRLSRRKAMGR